MMKKVKAGFMFEFKDGGLLNAVLIFKTPTTYREAELIAKKKKIKFETINGVVADIFIEADSSNNTIKEKAPN